MTFEEAHLVNMAELDKAWSELRKCADDMGWCNQNDDYKRLLRSIDTELNVVFRLKNAFIEAKMKIGEKK